MITAKELMNQSVVHKVFGKGVICSTDGNHLEVAFKEKDGVHKFGYPACFHGYLSMEDEGLQKEVNVLVEAWRKESGIAQKEAVQVQHEKTMKRMAARRAAAETKRMKAAQRAMEHRANYNYRERKQER